MPKAKALVLLSGGLDSILAAKTLQIQGIGVEGICFACPFFGAEKARAAASNLGIKLRVVDLSKEMIDLVKNPPSGYGKHLNPCLDCHALMIRQAAEFLKKNSGEFDFVATGEVLGQRPFSQNRSALKRIEKLAGVEIVRPLSAKLLEATEVEKNGLVNREKLLDIEGRSRERQMDLAEGYGLKDYPSPAGGCILTDPEFSRKLNVLLGNWPDCGANDIELIKNGRVFWLNLKKNEESAKILAVIGRNNNENENLKKLAVQGDMTLSLKNFPGPEAIIRKKNVKPELKTDDNLEIIIPEKLNQKELNLTAEKGGREAITQIAVLTGYYAVKARGKKAEFSIKQKI